MAAPVLLSDYKMKKKKALAAKRESEAPVTLGFMREFRAEIMSRFTEIDERFKQVDARFDGIDARLDGIDARLDGIDARLDGIDARFDGINARLDGIDARIDGVDARFDGIDARLNGMDAQIVEIKATLNEGLARMDTKFHEAKLMAEEQNLRNRQAYDSYALTEGALQDLKDRIRPECLEE